MSADAYDVRRARMDGLAEGMLVTQEGLAVIAAAMDCVTVILARHPGYEPDSPWFAPSTHALVAAVRKFATTEQPRKCAWDGCPKAAASWSVCDDHLDTGEMGNDLAMDMKGPNP